jgi:hypothetical protein
MPAKLLCDLPFYFHLCGPTGSVYFIRIGVKDDVSPCLRRKPVIPLNIPGYFSKSSPTPNWVGFTKTLTTTRSFSAFAF